MLTMQDSTHDHLCSLFAQADVHAAYSDCFIQAYQSAAKDDTPVEMEIRLPFKSYIRSLIAEQWLPQKSLEDMAEWMFKCIVISLDKYDQWHHVDDWTVTQDTIHKGQNAHHQYRETTGMVTHLPDDIQGIYTCKSRYMDLVVKPNHHVYPMMIFSMSSEANLNQTQFKQHVASCTAATDEANGHVSKRGSKRYIRLKERKSWFLNMMMMDHAGMVGDPTAPHSVESTQLLFRIDMTRVWSADNETMAHWYRRSQKPDYEIEIECVDAQHVLYQLQGRSDVLLAYMILTLIRVIRPALMKNLQQEKMQSDMVADYQLIVESMVNYQDEYHDLHPTMQTDSFPLQHQNNRA